MKLTCLKQSDVYNVGLREAHDVFTPASAYARYFEQPSICIECTAVYADYRWTFDQQAIKEAEQAHVLSTTCPACIKKRDGVAGGYLHLDGQFFLSHQNEVESLLEHESRQAGIENALDCIMIFDRGMSEMLTVVTTTKQMAIRLGHAVETAYGGAVYCGFSHNQEFVSVWWHKN
jgi:hypothetical protein